MINKFYKYLDLEILGRIMSFIRPYKKIFVYTLILTVILGFIAPVRPYMIKIMVDDFVPTKDKQQLLNFSIYLVLLLLGESVMQYFQIYLANLLGQDIIKDLRVKLYNKELTIKSFLFRQNPNRYSHHKGCFRYRDHSGCVSPEG